MAPHDEDEFEAFGPYVVYERLGVGGMATVHRAKERGIEGFERIVALKRLLPHLAEDESFVRAFVREAKLASLLQHANIVQLYELGRVGHQYFISMELIEGRDIRKILRQSKRITGPPPINVVISLLTQLCDALDYAHTREDEHGAPLGLVHRDVSPSNVIVTTSGHVKVIDFGIAKAQSLQLRTQTGRVKGKLAYMAPEAIKGLDLDGRSDLFSAGVIAHELLTARPLFATKTDYHTLMRVQRAEVAPPSTLNRDCPPELDAIVLKALAKDPVQRWQSAADVRDALHDLRRKYQLNATNREVSAWLEWAFALEAPVSGRHRAASRSDVSQSFSQSASRSASRSPVSSASFPQVLFEASDLGEEPVLASLQTPNTGPMDFNRVPRAMPPAEDDEDVVDIAWGGDEQAVPVLLDDVPDVSDKVPLPAGGSGRSARAKTSRGSRGGASVSAYTESKGATIVGLPPPKVSDFAPEAWPAGTTPPPLLDGSFLTRTPTSSVTWTDEAGSHPHIAVPPVEDESAEPLETVSITKRRQTLNTTVPEVDADTPKPRRSRPVTQFGASIVERHNNHGIRNAIIAGVVVLGVGAALLLTRGDSKKSGRDVATAEGSAGSAMIKFAVDPENAIIEVEGQEPHTGSPYSLELGAGTYDVTVRSEGFASWVTRFEVVANENQTVRVALKPAAAGNATQGVVSIETTPSGLTVSVDGEKVDGETPLQLPLDPGERTIAIHSEYGEVWNRTLQVAANTQYELQPDLKRAIRDAKRRDRRERHSEQDDDDDDDDRERKERKERKERVDVEFPDEGGKIASPAALIGGTSPSNNTLGGLDIEAVEPPPPAVVQPKVHTEPVVILSSAVTKISGNVPSIQTRHEVSRVDAKLCIDHKGKVTSVSLITKLHSEAQKVLRKTLKAWRYKPYKVDGDPVPACFVVTFTPR